MKLILAVSGGIDSMVLADIVGSRGPLCPDYCECVAIAHCNFGLRPVDCDGDEVLVRNWAAGKGIHFYSKHFDTERYAAEHSCGTEVAARELRYRWFAELCKELDCDGVATAHHADDNLETLLLNIVRGCGLRGICGMNEIDFLPYQESEAKLILARPLIRMSRDEIRHYAVEHGISWREDCTNSENVYRRNRLRNEVIPILKEMNPSLAHTVAAEQENFRCAALALEDWNRSTAERLIDKDSSGAETVIIKDLLECASPLQMLWGWLDGKGFSRDNIIKACELLRNGSQGGKYFKSESHCLYIGSETISLNAIEGERLTVTCEISDWNNTMSFKPAPGCLMLNADSLGEYELSNPEDGDWFVPLGMHGRKKLSDWFTDIKATRRDKDEAVVVIGKDESGRKGRHVAAVICRKAARQDEATRLGENSHRVLKLSWV